MRLILSIVLAFSTSAFAQFGSPNDLAFWYPNRVESSGYTPYAVTFDGSNDYMTVTNSQTGMADGYGFTYSEWLKPTLGVDGRLMSFFVTASLRYYISVLADGRINVQAYSSGGTLKVSTFTVNPLTASVWTHVYIALSRTTPLTNFYFNGTLTAVTNATWVGNDGNPNDYDNPVSGRYTVGADYTGLNKINSDRCELWWDDTMFDDPTKFRDSGTGKPISLGSDGSTPTGSAPVFYFRGQQDGWAVNYGTGGTNFWVKGAFADTTPP